MNVSAINFVSIFTHCESLSARYCKLLGQYADPLCVYISMLVQATLIVRRQFLCHYFHVNASSCATMSIYCVSISARYCKQLCQYVYSMCVSISMFLQAAVPLCRPTVCLYLLVIASSCASMFTHCVSICTLLKAGVSVCRHTAGLYLQVTVSICANMSTHCLSLSLYCKQLCQNVNPLCVSISTLRQASVPVCRHSVCLYLHVTSSSFASMSTHCLSPSPRYCKQLCHMSPLCMSLSAGYSKQLCQYVEPLFVSISTLLQAFLPVCRPTVCDFLHITASNCACNATHYVSLFRSCCK